MARENFGAYCQLLARGYELAYHHQRIVKQLMRVEQGHDRRVIIQAPPRHGKSHTTTTLFPAWYLGRHPDRKIISASCTQDLADDFGGRVRNLIQDPIHRAVFPECEMSGDTQAKDHFTLTAGGEYFAVGRGSTTVGRGANLFLVDDPTKDKIEAKSETIQSQMYDWFTTVARTRLEPPNAVLLIETLWSEAGLSAWLPRNQPKVGWKTLRFPAIAEEDEYDEDGTLCRKEGDALWPSRFPLPDLEEQRDGMRSDDWLALFQQRATAETGNYFKVAWLERCYYERPNLGEGLNKYIFIDPASSKKKGADFTCMWVLGFGADRNVYVLDIVRDHLSPSELADAMFSLHAKWLPISVICEEYALSAIIALVRERQERMNYRFDIQPIGGAIRKGERIKELEPWFRTGRLQMPRHFMYRSAVTGADGEDLLKPFLEEYRSFPNAAHDDMLDSLARFTDPKFLPDWPMTQQQMNRYAAATRMASSRGSWMAG